MPKLKSTYAIELALAVTACSLRMLGWMWLVDRVQQVTRGGSQTKRLSAVDATSLVSLDVCAVVLEHAPLGLQTKERLQLGYLAVCADLRVGQN